LGSDTIYLIKCRQVSTLTVYRGPLPRYFVPGQPQHIILRGNNRQAIFAAEQDYLFFRDCLVEAAQRFGLGVHAYVWMTNHVHLLATPNDGASLPKALQSAGGARSSTSMSLTGARARYGKGATGRR
jgi:REP element-mobilizing transposase RayT